MDCLSLTYQDIVAAKKYLETPLTAYTNEQQEYLKQWDLMQNALTKAYYNWRVDYEKQFSH